MDAPREINLTGSDHDIARWIWKTLVPKSGQAAFVQAEILRAIEKLRWEAQGNGKARSVRRVQIVYSRKFSAEPMPGGCECIVAFGVRVAHNDGEVTWSSQQRTRFAFGTMATPRRRRGFTPRLFRIRPSARCTARR